MKIILTGGGTAGHINPALAIASYIKQRHENAEILFIGTSGMESRLVPEAGFNFQVIEVAGFQRKLKLQNIKRNAVALGRMVTASIQAKKCIKQYNPDLVIGTGGYVSGPVVRAAAGLGVKTLIHEQNAFPGVTTKLLSKHAHCVMLASETARMHFGKNIPIEITGNPIREEIIMLRKEQARQELGLDDRSLILSFGGSLGARQINEAVAYFIGKTSGKMNWQYIHAYGQFGKWMPPLTRRQGADLKNKSIDLRGYISNMPLCLAAADLVICRAGALTLSELTAQGKPAILIPSPNVAENHQYHNAMELVQAGAARIIEEKKLTGESLTAEVTQLLENKQELEIMHQNSQKLAILDANERIYRIVMRCLQEK